ncbi:MAG: peptide MFS transporter [Planctomycetes bacterium]|nr:peptide MFS transporter [Planctomycetota bacterium]
MSSAPAATSKHPLGLYVLFASEMWERFSFYSVQAMLVLYVKDPKDGFGWDQERASGLYGWYVMSVYFSPLLGGLIADRFLGNRRSVILGGIFFVIGHALLGLSGLPFLYAGLSCLVVGNGFFKPNVSTMVGNLYSEGSKLKDAAYSLFYMGINIGALGAPIAMEFIRAEFGFHPAFATAAVGMALSVAILFLFKSTYAHADRMPGGAAAKQDQAQVALPIDAVPDLHRAAALVVVFALGVAFWTLFWQNGNVLTIWADSYTDWGAIEKIVGQKVTGILSNAINPGFVVMFGPIVAALWQSRAQAGKDLSTPAKMTLGMACATVGGAIMFLAAREIGHDVVIDTKAPVLVKASPWWLVGSYALVSLGEILLSAMGLSLVSQVAPKRWRAMLMGGWFVSISLGGFLSGKTGTYWNKVPHTQFFAGLSLGCLFATVILFLSLRGLRKAMPGV